MSKQGTCWDGYMQKGMKKKGGKGGGKVGAGGSAVSTGFVPFGSCNSLGGTTKGT